MGYTHYWTPKVATNKKWKEFKETCKKLHDNLPARTATAGGYYKDDPLEIRSWNGFNKPEFTMKGVNFNGDELKGLDHENFYLTPTTTEWNFCKTARKPYDLLVVACLIAAHEILGYEVSSDGDITDWVQGIQLYLDTIYDFKEMPDEDQLRAILPEFLFKEQKGSEYREPYSVMEIVNDILFPNIAVV